jgi:hypothetical protein
LFQPENPKHPAFEGLEAKTIPVLGDDLVAEMERIHNLEQETFASWTGNANEHAD